MNNPERLIFVHIPKSAGMTLFTALRDIYGEDRTLRYADSSLENRNKYLSMTHDEIRRFHFITGHLPLPLFLNKSVTDYKIFTVVRDPIDRELSAYYYMKTWAKHPMYEQVRKWDLYQYLDFIEKNKSKNPQCWHLSGKINFDLAKEYIDKNIFLATPLEYLKEFCVVLQHRLNLPEIKLARKNTTEFRFTKAELHPDIIERLNKMTEDDNKLYHYIKEKFSNMILSEFKEIVGKLPEKDSGILTNF